MRKILITTVLLVCVIASVFIVGCDTSKKEITFKDTGLEVYKYTGSFEGNGMAWIDAIAAADSYVVFTHSFNEMYNSETIGKVKYKGVTIEDDTAKNSYLTYYTNLTDIEIADYKVDPFIFENETYYLTAVTLDKIPVSKGLKVLFVQTVWAGDWSSSEVSTEKAILFSYVGA